MIISASRRTDIPAFYSEWFMNRLKDGYALIPNPRNLGRIGKVTLSPDNVDCIVFWTKNPAPMLDKFDSLDAMRYHYYIQFTLTPYDKTVETHLPSKAELLQTFIEMSKRTGKKRAVWRYDPVFIDEKHSTDWHKVQFSKMCDKLQPYTERCVLSFIDLYRNISGKYRSMQYEEMIDIAAGFSKIAKQCGISLYTCSEKINLKGLPIGHSACIDRLLIEQITGSRIKAKKDANQREECCCIESVDIGAYDTCPHGCTYCYAASSVNIVLKRAASHNPAAPMITGYPKGGEIITDRTGASQKINQISMF